MDEPAASGTQRKGFFALLEERVRANRSLLCIGIDPPLDNAAGDSLFSFGRRIVEATAEAACTYKPNIAFYEARGPKGLEALRETIDFIHSLGFPVILDAKRGDISATASAYAHAAFDVCDADALTVNPLLGADSVEPFASRAERGVFVLCHTSNPGAADFQELQTPKGPLYERIARMAVSWNTGGNIGLVIGATFPWILESVRRIAPDMWFLIPGVGSQGGDLEASLEAGLTAEASGVLINVSRGISGAADPRKAAIVFRDRINETREKILAAHRHAAGQEPGMPLSQSIALGLFDLGAVRFGEFTLKSGMKSPIYIDLRLLVSDPGLMGLVAKAMGELLSGLSFDRIAAIPYGGLPIGQAVSLETGKPLIYPRREVKEYGTKKPIEGKFETGETVVVLDDLITTGGSKIEAVDPLKEAGLAVRDMVVLIDREQGGARELEKRGYTLHAVLTVSELLDTLVSAGRIGEDVRARVREALGIA